MIIFKIYPPKYPFKYVYKQGSKLFIITEASLIDSKCNISFCFMELNLDVKVFKIPKEKIKLF